MEEVFGLLTGQDVQTKVAMEAILENYPGESISEVVSLVNANYSDPDNVPSGIIMIHPETAIVHPDSIPKELFQYTVACKIQDKDGTLTDEYFKKHEDDLRTSIPQYNTKPPRIDGVFSNTSNDKASWGPELGENGFAGIYKEMHPNQRETTYYVVIKAAVPKACRELRQKFIRKQGRKFKEIVQDPVFNFTTKLAERNAQRLAYCVAQVCNVKLARKIEDSRAYLERPSTAAPYLGLGYDGFSQPTSVIDALVWKGEGKIALFHKARAASRVQDTCMVDAGPYNGLTLFKLKNGVVGPGLPNTTKSTRPSEVGQIGSTDKAKRRARGFTWEGKDGHSHPDLHPERHTEVNDEFLEAMSNLGWDQRGVHTHFTLVPVVVKLSNPDIKRK